MTLFMKWPRGARLSLLSALSLSFCAGSVSSLAMAPSNYWLLLFPCLSLLYVLLSNAGSARFAAVLCWLFGLGYFLFGLWWIGNALLVEGNDFAWVWPISVIGLPLLLSSFTAATGYIAYKFSDLKKISGFFAFVASYLLMEWMRGNILSGFPWNLFGYMWADIPELVQTVSIGSIYLLTWLTILWAALPGFLIVTKASNKQKIILSVGLILSLALCYGFGSSRIRGYEVASLENVRVKIVQPNIPQSQKWDRGRMTENFFKHIRLSYPEDENTNTTYIVWPETALSHWYTQDQTSMNLIRQALQSYRGKAYLVTGLLRHDAKAQTYSNSIALIDSEGTITNIYDKNHLVPFGEFIPLQKWIPIKPVAEFSGFQHGSGAASFKTPEGFRYAPLICYEVIFPGILSQAEDAKLDFIINVTNDAWYGISAGPHQHFTNARFRAVEEGAPLVRAANTGISALVNPLGEVEYAAQLSVSESKTLKIPQRLNTIYSRVPFQNAIFVILALFFIAFGHIYRI